MKLEKELCRRVAGTDKLRGFRGRSAKQD